MKFALLTKRHYTNKDLLSDRFGRLFHLPDQLSKMGNEGLVIVGDLHAQRFETIRINDVEYRSMPLSITRLPGFIKKSNKIIEDFKPDLIIASSDSYWGYLGQRAANRLNIPFVFDVYDDYTTFGSNRMPGMKSLFYRAVKNADLVMTAGQSLCDILTPFNKSIIDIENGYAPELFHPIPLEEARQKLGIPSSKTVIGYFGSLEPELGIEELIEATRILESKIPEVRLLMAGRDNIKLDYASYNIDYRGFLPQEQIPILINACNVVVIPYLPSKMKQLCNACKIAEYVACQKPVVATDISDHATIFTEAPQSLCEPGNIESMASAIKAQLESPEIIKHSGYLTWKNLARKLSDELLRLVH